MRTLRASSPWCAVPTAIALALAPISCKDKDEPKAESASGQAKPDADDKEAKDAEEGKADDGGIAAKAKEVMEVVAGPRDIEPSYPVELDKLLDLVPADAENFFVVRDAGALVHGMLAYATAQKAASQRIADEIAKTDPGDADEFRQVLTKLDELGTKLESSGIDLGAGVVFAKMKGEKADLIVYGSAKADALTVMLAALGDKDVPENCSVVASAAGYSVCMESGVSAYAPGNRAKELRSKITDKLPGIDLERANIAAFVVDDDGGEVPFIVETGQGMAHVAFALPKAREDLAKFTHASSAPLLGIVGPGEPFMWGQLSPTAILAESGPVPGPFQPFAKSLTGEFLMGGVAGMKGFTATIGVNDPAPTTGLFALASLGFSEIPKDLPDGSKLEVALETVKAGTSDVQTIHAKVTGTTPAYKTMADMGYTPDVYAFAAGKVAAVSIGTKADIVTELAKNPAGGPSQEMLDALPTPLAKSLKDGKSVAAVYLPFDAMHSADAVALWEAMAENIPPPRPGVDPKNLARLSVDAIAPLSSFSLWVTDVDKGPVVHIAVQGFGVEGTEEGKAAFEALAAVAGGGDRKATYGALASKFPSSSRVSSYKARAGDIGDAMASLMAGLVGLGGVGFLLFASSKESPATSSAVAAPPAVAVPVAPPPPSPPK